MKGDVIVFPHNLETGVEGIVQTGAKSWIDAMMTGISWVSSTFKVTLVGPQDEQDNLWRWLSGKDIILARSAVIFNHCLVRHFLDHEVLGNISEPFFKPDLSKLKEFEDMLRKFRVEQELKASAVSDELSCAIERLAQTKTDDVASVRTSDQGGSLAFAAVLESTETDSTTREEYFETVRNTTFGTEAQGAVISRGENPINEFSENGINIMRLYRNHFPLMQTDYQEEEHDPGKRRKKERQVSRPLKANGTVPVVEMRHMLLQYTTQIAKELSLVFYPANQTQRHAVVRSNSFKLQGGHERRFHEILSDPLFEDRLKAAILDPDTPDANQLFRDCVRIFTSVGQSKPWSAHQRQAMMSKMYALADRHSHASIFYTIALDDTRNLCTVRLSFPSQSNNHFPGFATRNARCFWEKNGGDVDATEQDDIREMLQACKGDGFITLELGKTTDEFTSSRFQRIVVENPVAATQVFEAFTQAAKRILFRVDVDLKKTYSRFHCSPGDTFTIIQTSNEIQKD